VLEGEDSLNHYACGLQREKESEELLFPKPVRNSKVISNSGMRGVKGENEQEIFARPPVACGGGGNRNKRPSHGNSYLLSTF
jgi:hypothetical protein